MTMPILTAKDLLVQRIKDRAHYEDVKLSTGSITNIYLDIKGCLDNGEHINMMIDAFFEHLFKHDLTDFDVIGGPTMGADVISLGVVSSTGGGRWFSIREPKKTHGLGKTIEGTQLGPGDKVLLVDDVVSTGRSLLDAYGKVVVTGANVMAVVPLVDRSGLVARPFSNVGVPFVPVLTHKDLDIPSLVP